MSSPHLIPLAIAIDLLSSCFAVQVDQDSLCYPRLVDQDNPDNADLDEVGLFLTLETHYDEERFAIKDNPTVQVLDSGDLLFVNTMGEPTRLMPLMATPYRPAPEPVHATD